MTRLPYANGPDIDTRAFMANKKISISPLLKMIQERQAQINIIENNVDIFINAPAQAQLNKKKFISLSYIGIPIEFESCNEESEAKAYDEDNKVRILHAASTVGCRGTKQFRQCIIELQKKYEIEYVELTGVPNSKVIEEIIKCDFVLDELWSDMPLATFASEAAYYGKPAIVCGYFSEYYRKYYPRGSCPPSMFVLPKDLYCAVEKMICNQELREELGYKAKKFVRKYMNSKAVARRFYKAINGEIDDIWIIDPLEIGYIEGYGVDKEMQKKIVKEMYDKCGIEKMGTKGNPLLTERILNMINI